LNYALAAALEHGLLPDVNVIWGAGAAHVESCALLAQPGRVVVQGFFDPMSPAYRAADLVVCRAGAMTTAELCAWGKASLLVPLPTAAADHQMVNARALEAAAAAVVLPEQELTHVRLAQLVGELLSDPKRLTALADHARGRGRPTAARDIATRILSLVS
jgi:UDP-N-acetylglucosamine--N-acetylmuramyl-(pentapeptide) pyrophosphoryl-undecaprenol N-acetylglucosamine transferase